MGKIIIRNKKKKKLWNWSPAKCQKLLWNEQYMGNLLYKEPWLIPMEEIGRPPIIKAIWGLKVQGKEIDLLGFDEKGGITIIETKLSKDISVNPKRKNNVFKQIEKYKRKLKKCDYNSLDNSVMKNEKKSLWDLMKEEGKRMGLVGLNKNDFQQSVENTLGKGDFLVLIATENIGQCQGFLEELMNKRKNGDNIYALELACFYDKKSEIVHSRIFPTLSLPKEGVKKRGKEAIFFSRVNEKCDEKLRKTIREIYNWGKKRNDWELIDSVYPPPMYMDDIDFGFRPKGKKLSLFYLDCYGILRFRKDTDDNIIESLQKKLGKQIIDIVEDDWFYFLAEPLKNSQKMRSFKQLILRFANRIKK